MENRENAQKRLSAFENIDKTRTLNKNNTLSSFNESLTTNPVGKMVGQIQGDTSRNKNYMNYTYDGQKIEDFDDESDNYSEYNDSYIDEYSSEDLDTLNFQKELEQAKERKPFAHEIPYKREVHEDYDTLSKKQIEKINKSITNPYSKDLDAQDTSNLSTIDDVSDFFNDNESIKRKNHLRRNVEKNNRDARKSSNNNYYKDITENDYNDFDNTMVDLNALAGRKIKKGVSSNTSSYRLVAGNTLKEEIELNDRAKERKNQNNRPTQNRNTEEHREQRQRSSDTYNEQRNNNEDHYKEPRNRRESAQQVQPQRYATEAEKRRALAEERMEASRQRLRNRRSQDTNMQPAIKGQTINIPKSTINSIRNNESANYEENTHNYETSEYDNIHTSKNDRYQREQMANQRRLQEEDDNVQTHEPKKRSSEGVYKRRFEKARAQSVLFACIGLVVSLVILIAFFFTLYQYNDVKAKLATLEGDYAKLTYEQPDIEVLQLEVEALTEERDSLLAQLENGTSTEVNEDGTITTPTDENAETETGSKTYTVKAGDYLSLISQNEYGDTSHVEAIKTANGLTGDSLLVGQTLILP
ncbi:MAG: LysM peptidoglycan-binding domain-containing protein [Lachnospirales bacterium]